MVTSAAGDKGPGGIVLVPGHIYTFTNPLAAETNYRNENVIYLGNGEFLAHGIGIKPAKDILRSLLLAIPVQYWPRPRFLTFGSFGPPLFLPQLQPFAGPGVP